MLENDCCQSRKASVERPWLKYYPPELHNFVAPNMTISDFIKKRVIDDKKQILEYYGLSYSLEDIFAQADLAAKSLAAMGVKEGDHVLYFTKTVPEFLFMLFAVEKIGAALVCRTAAPKDLLEAIIKSNGSIAVVHDYLSKEEEELYYSAPNLKHIITLSPFTYGDKQQMPDYILENIEARYPEQCFCSENTITWNEFINKGADYSGSYEVEKDPNRPVYHSYTSGATGTPKETIHTAATMVGIISQMALITPPNITLRSLLTLLPPSLVTVVSPLVLYSIAVSNVLILSSFCELKDFDLDFMNYRPNLLVAIPLMAEALIRSKRIPEDYSMDFLYLIGGGADPANNGLIRRIQKFLSKHNCRAVYTMGYGMSEAGSAAAQPHKNSNYLVSAY